MSEANTNSQEHPITFICDYLKQYAPHLEKAVALGGIKAIKAIKEGKTEGQDKEIRLLNLLTMCFEAGRLYERQEWVRKF